MYIQVNRGKITLRELVVSTAITVIITVASYQLIDWLYGLLPFNNPFENTFVNGLFMTWFSAMIFTVGFVQSNVDRKFESKSQVKTGRTLIVLGFIGLAMSGVFFPELFFLFYSSIFAGIALEKFPLRPEKRLDTHAIQSWTDSELDIAIETGPFRKNPLLVNAMKEEKLRRSHHPFSKQLTAK